MAGSRSEIDGRPIDKCTFVSVMPNSDSGAWIKPRRGVGDILQLGALQDDHFRGFSAAVVVQYVLYCVYDESRED